MKAAALIAVVALAACCGRKNEAGGSGGTAVATTLGATAHALVYRTTADHTDRVPVLLSEDRSTIVSYPHPKDVRVADGYPLPTALANGYLLDNRGIGLNVAFLRYTYAEYAALHDAPPVAELEAAILERDPLVELCDCGPRNTYTDLVKELRTMIASRALDTRCKRLK